MKKLLVLAVALFIVAIVSFYCGYTDLSWICACLDVLVFGSILCIAAAKLAVLRELEIERMQEELQDEEHCKRLDSRFVRKDCDNEYEYYGLS